MGASHSSSEPDEKGGKDESQALIEDYWMEVMLDVGIDAALDKQSEAQYKEAVQATERGDESSKTIVAFYKLLGLGGAGVDVEGAIALLEERAKERDCEAKWILGLCCEHGMGMEQDIERAEVLYRESLEGGNAIGEFLTKNGKGGRGSGVMKVYYGL